MYISNITIKGFRNFDNTTVDFHDGINVIIGHNNAGKTNLLKALSLVTEGFLLMISIKIQQLKNLNHKLLQLK